MENNKKGKLFVYAGASGVGKGTIMKELVKRNESIKLSVSATTRAPRAGEVDGREYFFVTREKFEEMIKEDAFLEHAEYCNNYYGTPKAAVDEMLSNGINVFLEIELEGAMNIMRIRPEAVSIFILPPCIEELERRLRDRGTESEKDILNRLQRAEIEIKNAEKYKYTVVNDELEKAIEDVLEIVEKETR